MRGKMKLKVAKTISHLHPYSNPFSDLNNNINNSNNLNSNPDNNNNLSKSLSHISENPGQKKELAELKDENHDNNAIHTNEITQRIEYIEKNFSVGDYFEYNAYNKPGMNMIYFEAESDVDVIYLNNKKYNECFLSCITKTEKERKKFIINTIETMKDLPKNRFDIFYNNINVDVIILLIQYFFLFFMIK